MGDNIPSKWHVKESRCCHTYLRQSRLQDKKAYERQRGSVYNDKGDFPPRGHNTYKIYAPNTAAQKNIKQPLIDPK